MQELIRLEIKEKIALAKHLHLLPKDINEVEFTLEVKLSGDHEQKEATATLIEFWPTVDRIESKRVEVIIPFCHTHLFRFPLTTKFYIKNIL